MQNSSGKRIEASQGNLNEVIKATGTVDAHILVMSYTLLLNEGIPRAYRGKKLPLKNILFFPSKSEGITCNRF